MTPIVEPMPRRINLLGARPRRRNAFRPDTDHEHIRRRMEAAVALVGALWFCLWLGGRIHAAVMAGSRPFVAVAEQVAGAVSGR